MTVRESLITIIESRGAQAGNVTSYRHSHPAGIYVMEMASYDGKIGVVTLGLVRGPGECKISLYCSYSPERTPVFEVGCWERVIRQMATAINSERRNAGRMAA